MALVIASTTSSVEEMEHAVSDNWREPFVPKPVDGEAPATEETPVETTPESETGEKTEQQPPEKKKSNYDKRIDKLVAKQAQAEARAEKAEREAAELRAKLKPEESARPANQPPQLKDYETPEEWADARDVWKASEESKAAQIEAQKATFADYNKHVSDARAKHEDFDEVVGRDDINIPQSVQLAVVEMENGPEVAYYLGKNPEKCEELLQMTPLSAVRAIERIAAGLEPAAKAPQKQKVTPPAPLAPVGGSSTRSTLSLDDVPLREFMNVRNKQERDRRR